MTPPHPSSSSFLRRRSARAPASALTAAALGALSLAACKGEPASAPAVASAKPSAAASAPASAPEPAAKREAAAPADSASACAALPALASRYPAPARVVAIGDLHGDLDAALRALSLAGAIASPEAARAGGETLWTGGDMVLVQTGDVLDRGDDEQAILDLLARLEREARAAGGAVHALLGNHETMNAAGDFRYVTPGGFSDFADAPGVAAVAEAPALAAVPAQQRARAAAFLPGGVYAERLAARNTVVVVGDTVFAHGGVVPRWAEYGIERVNAELRCWLAGEARPPAVLLAEDNPMWSRDFSREPAACDALERALAALDATRMVVGHTPQADGITSACDGRVWRIDTGMAAHYGGAVQALELRGDSARILSEDE
ncbi:metallophosphoesterase [Haliangium ochraceum]|uniref:Metallophosphoesterase n=1 Tax=Haliangium ochraceum (strain DSM 14365 / JCM 11303 / SMP-2) TaxID=502025 RepID=D0LQ64_HALO1|nr:metallophosphoesterase [Haliangium ochraceum]ACY17101.1 metallophosphoesterase [Haliangium ochraceum DSM 14365]